MNDHNREDNVDYQGTGMNAFVDNKRDQSMLYQKKDNGKLIPRKKENNGALQNLDHTSTIETTHGDDFNAMLRRSQQRPVPSSIQGSARRMYVSLFFHSFFLSFVFSY